MNYLNFSLVKYLRKCKIPDIHIQEQCNYILLSQLSFTEHLVMHIYSSTKSVLLQFRKMFPIFSSNIVVLGFIS